MRKVCTRVVFYKSRELKFTTFIQLGFLYSTGERFPSAEPGGFNLAEGRAKCFTADLAKSWEVNNVDKLSTRQSDRSKYPVKTITLILGFNSLSLWDKLGFGKHFT